MSDPEPDTSERLPLDRSAESEMATLRLVGALVVIPASLWGMSLGPGLVGWILAVAGLGVGIFWIVAFVRAKKRIRDQEEHYLLLGAEELVLKAPTERKSARWSEIREITVDEEKLRITLSVGEDALHIEPCYGGLGVYDLAERIRAQRARVGGRA